MCSKICKAASVFDKVRADSGIQRVCVCVGGGGSTFYRSEF